MDALRAGIENMLRSCAGLRAGQSLLIIAEEPGARYYDPALADDLARVARAVGLRVAAHTLPFTAQAEAPPPAVMDAMRRADATVFLSRRGDQLRFDPVMAESAPIICYALDHAMMASDFGRADHHGMVALMEALNAALAAARHIRVNCPLGTDFEGPGARFPDTAGEVTIRRFPLSVFSPIPAEGYRGSIALAGFVPGSGRTYFNPNHLPLEGVLHLRFAGTEITGFDGPDAARAVRHFDRVGSLLNIDPRYLHSWHGGIHPGCNYTMPSWGNPARWSGGAFGNPRVLHFHACGAFAPGEISLNVIDPTIALDGVPVWETGRLHPERVAGGAEVLARFPSLAAAFAAPAQALGLTSQGRLSAYPVAQDLAATM